MWLVTLSGPRRAAAKLMMLILTAWLSWGYRDSARGARTRPAVCWRQGRALGRTRKQSLAAQKTRLPNGTGCSFSSHWKPQGCWVWHTEVQKACRGWLTVFYVFLLIWCSWVHDNKISRTLTQRIMLYNCNCKTKTPLNIFPFPLFACEKDGISLCCCEDVCCPLWQITVSDILDVEMVSKIAEKSKQHLEIITAPS